MSSNVPKPTFGPNGFQAPEESQILGGVLADFNAAFGGDLNPALETPQGQLATSMAAVIGFCNDLFLHYANQVDPAFSEGRMQDAIGRLYFLERQAAEPTTVQATCSGLSGTVIPVGALARAADGNVYSCTASGTIGSGGTVVLPFACVTPGPITCLAGSLSTVYRTIPGWDSVTNAADGALGRDTETRADFEARRAASVALNAVGTVSAIRANVLTVPDVLDAYVTENFTGASITTGGVAIAAHSLFVAVSGGLAADVAKAIWQKKPPGCGYVGDTTVTVTDDSSGYEYPYPTYSVTFKTADPTAVGLAVTIIGSPAVPSDAADQIKAALVSAFQGGDGGPRARIGALLLAARFYAPVALLGPWATQILSIKIGLAGFATFDELQMQIDQAPTLSATDITVTLA